MINLNDKKYPFGGACNKYYNLLSGAGSRTNSINYVQLRQHLVFEKYIYPANIPEETVTIGIPKSFLTNNYYPLYYNFFTQLGFKVIPGDNPLQSGQEKKQAAFCYPVELAHGFFKDLIEKKVDHIFIPHILEIKNLDSTFYERTCVFVQTENYYLRTTFKEELGETKILSPLCRRQRISKKGIY